MVPVVSGFYCLGSTIFLGGAIWYLADNSSEAIPYLSVACACCYFVASGLQVVIHIKDWMK